MDNRIQSSDDILDASKIVVRGGCFPVRIVLRKLPGKFVTHEEMLKSETPDDGSSCKFVHHGFGHGHYFDFNDGRHGDSLSLPTEEYALKRAMEDFKERAGKL